MGCFGERPRLHLPDPCLPSSQNFLKEQDAYNLALGRKKSEEFSKSKRVEPSMGVPGDMLTSHGRTFSERFGASMTNLHFSHPATRQYARGTRRCATRRQPSPPHLTIGACARAQARRGIGRPRPQVLLLRLQAHRLPRPEGQPESAARAHDGEAGRVGAPEPAVAAGQCGHVQVDVQGRVLGPRSRGARTRTPDGPIRFMPGDTTVGSAPWAVVRAMVRGCSGAGAHSGLCPGGLPFRASTAAHAPFNFKCALWSRPR